MRTRALTLPLLAGELGDLVARSGDAGDRALTGPDASCRAASPRGDCASCAGAVGAVAFPSLAFSAAEKAGTAGRGSAVDGLAPVIAERLEPPAVKQPLGTESKAQTAVCCVVHGGWDSVCERSLGTEQTMEEDMQKER